MCVIVCTTCLKLTKGRPKPKKASRKHLAEPLDEKEGLTTYVPRSSTTNGATRTPTLVPSPSPSRDILASVVTVRAPGTPSHADSQLLLDTPQPTSIPQVAKCRTKQASNGMKSPDSVASNDHKKTSLVGLAADRVLPGIIPSPSQPLKPLPPQSASMSPRSPRRHNRIPSTGSRALVMDVAQALQQAQLPPEAEVAIECPIVPQRVKHHSPTTEKRQSSYDKYTAFVMPPLVEEHALPARSVDPEPAVEIRETVADLASQESEMSDVTMPGQKDDIFVEIRE